MKEVTLNLKIEYCDQCPFYKRVETNGGEYFWIECEKTKYVLYDENKGSLTDGKPLKNYPLPNAT
jgi:hypothetical protein